MRQNEITIGMQATVKIGSRYATVTILQELPARHNQRRRFSCQTHDTRRHITATAARLRHVFGTPGDAAENARAASRQRRIGRDQRAAEARPWTMPEGNVVSLATARPVPGLIARVGRLLRRTEDKSYGGVILEFARIADGEEVYEPWNGVLPRVTEWINPDENGGE